MKTKNLLLALLSASLLYACTNDDTHIPVANDQETEATNEVSLNAAKNMLEDFVGEMNARSGSSFKIKSHQVKTVYVNASEALGRSAQEAIPVYEFITETDGKEGYSVVVGDKRVEKVLISVPQGSIADTAHIKPLKWYYEDIPLLIEQDLKQYYEGTKETTVQSRMTAETIYKFTPTNWGTEYPYDAQYPAYYEPSCGAISIAQILAYHRIPTNLSWSEILVRPSLDSSSSATAINQVSTLIVNLDIELNTDFDDPNGSRVDEVNIIPAMNAYGLTCGGMRGFTIFDGKLSLQNGGPFLLGAQGSNSSHLWVCDGWKKHIYDDGSYYEYLNMNWGWSGNSNGFFLVENPMSFSANGSLFNSNFRMAYNVRKQ
ncbi:MAG: C10 family peptidase [Bacteroidaceae bacterium]|nr:C10 family peptidase [Bacteroidaceae bacterium]